ncbi:MAG TPA: hypothetical protein VH985_20830 [Candidatus Binatia bacterium]
MKTLFGTMPSLSSFFALLILVLEDQIAARVRLDSSELGQSLQRDESAHTRGVTAPGLSSILFALGERTYF